MNPADPSLSPGAELRGAPRFTVLVRTAKLIVDGREYLCVLRDASNTGVKIRLFHPLPPGDSLAIEVGGSDRYPADVMWSRDDHAGLRFHEPIDVRRLLDDSRGDFPKRQLRLSLDRPAILSAHGSTYHTLLRNISQQGACIECSDRLLLREPVRIESDGLPALFGKICWRRWPLHGVVFEQGFSLEGLAHLVERIHQGGPGKSLLFPAA